MGEKCSGKTKIYLRKESLAREETIYRHTIQFLNISFETTWKKENLVALHVHAIPADILRVPFFLVEPRLPAIFLSLARKVAIGRVSTRTLKPKDSLFGFIPSFPAISEATQNFLEIFTSRTINFYFL